MQKIKIIGIGGTNGSGKDTVGQMLAKYHGWLFVSVTDILRDELRRRGVAIERKNTRNLSAEWRQASGLGVLVDKASDIFSSQTKQYNGLAIASLRNSGEVDRVHELGGVVVWVDADPEVRYKRIESRARSPEDHKTYDEFIAEEQAEMHNNGDKTSLDGAGVKAKADIFIQNNGSDIEEFMTIAQKALQKYL